MKFFTIQWWAGALDALKSGEDHDAAAREYEAHLHRIRDSLPVELRRFAEEVSLHDASLLKMELDVHKQTLVINLYQPVEGNACSPEYVAISLEYGSVLSLESTGDPEDCVLGPPGYGDLGYDELDVADGCCEHRMLFSTGIEFCVRFKEFSYRIMKVPGEPV